MRYKHFFVEVYRKYMLEGEVTTTLVNLSISTVREDFLHSVHKIGLHNVPAIPSHSPIQKHGIRIKCNNVA